MKKSIITVSREFGSGGRTIGKTVAQRLGIPYYDKELVKQVALESLSLIHIFFTRLLWSFRGMK